jgi:hypothetical protein
MKTNLTLKIEEISHGRTSPKLSEEKEGEGLDLMRMQIISTRMRFQREGDVRIRQVRTYLLKVTKMEVSFQKYLNFYTLVMSAP